MLVVRASVSCFFILFFFWETHRLWYREVVDIQNLGDCPSGSAFLSCWKEIRNDGSVLIRSQRWRVGRAEAQATAFLVGENEEFRSEEEEYSEDSYYSPRSLTRRWGRSHGHYPWLGNRFLWITWEMGNLRNLLEQFEGVPVGLREEMTGLALNRTYISSYCSPGKHSTLSQRAVHPLAATRAIASQIWRW